jgi:diguanylate cyclase (GGDEF)-like protein/PAS domain S-box-containing protein
MLRKYSIAWRIACLLAVFILFTAGALVMVLHYTTKAERAVRTEVGQMALQGHKDSIQDMTHCLGQILGQALSALPPGADPEEAIRRVVNPLRYESDGSGYYFVYRGTVIVALPPRPELVGRDMVAIGTNGGITKLAEAARAGGGFVEYVFPKPNGREQKKLSYAEMIPGTDYWLGTGVYMDDVDLDAAGAEARASAIFREQAWIMLLACALTSGVMLALTLITARGITGPLAQAVAAAEKIAGGDLNVSLDESGQDEPARLNRALNRLGATLTANIREIEDKRAKAEAEAETAKGLVAERDTQIGQRIKAETQARQVAEDLRFAATVFDNSVEGICVTDTRGTIIRVNPAFTAITGIPTAEAVGANPRVLKSDRHPPAFYHKMWQSLTREGQWAGEIWNRRKSGEAYPEWLNISAVRDDSGETTHYVAVFHDMSEIRRQQESLEYQANFDALTGLPNRILLMDRLEVALTAARRHGHKLAVIFLDLDNFKHVNESLGFAAGDELLKELAGRLSRALSADNTLGRLGGDEFLAIMPEIEGPDDASESCGLISRAMRQGFQVGGMEVFLTASAGIAVSPDDGQDPGELVKNAELALYRSKHLGRDMCHFFTPELGEKARRRLTLESDLRRALENDEFELFYQPLVDMRTGLIKGAEALSRWHRDGVLVSPAEFIPLAEETGLIVPLGAWALNESCRQAKVWLEKAGGLTMSVNLSSRQFRQHDLEHLVEEALAGHALPRESLHLEITESVLMANMESAAKRLHMFKELGAKIILDDFGTGFSSLSYLKHMPIDGLKIDRSFVKDITSNPDSLAIAKAIMALAKSLGLGLVTEGVETMEQLALLRGLGCRLFQGYLASPPVPAPEFERLLAEQNPIIEPIPHTG